MQHLPLSPQHSSEGRFSSSLCLMVTWLSGFIVQPHIRVLSVSGRPPSCPADPGPRRVFLCPHPGSADSGDRHEDKGPAGSTAPCGTHEAGGSRVPAQMARKRASLLCDVGAHAVLLWDRNRQKEKQILLSSWEPECTQRLLRPAGGGVRGPGSPGLGGSYETLFLVELKCSTVFCRPAVSRMS